MIIDYSVARPSIAALKAAGVTAVGRYLGWDSVPGHASIGKNLLTAEAARLRDASIGIFLAFEYNPDAVLKGAAQGRADGELATAQLHALGAPPGMTVYFAVDFDIGDYAPHSGDPRAKLGAAAHYFDAIAALKPAYQVGVYGGYWAVSRVLDAHLAAMAWQTTGWSGGRWDPRAVIRQEPGAPLAGTDLDQARLHTVHGPDFGQWPRPSKPSPAPGGPVKVITHVTGGSMSLEQLAVQHHSRPATILRLTAAYHGEFPGNVAAYVNAVFGGRLLASSPMPQGLHLRIPA